VILTVQSRQGPVIISPPPAIRAKSCVSDISTATFTLFASPTNRVHRSTDSRSGSPLATLCVKPRAPESACAVAQPPGRTSPPIPNADVAIN